MKNGECVGLHIVWHLYCWQYFYESGVCVFFDRFYHTMDTETFLFTGMSFFLTGQIIHEYQDKIVCKRLEQWMQWGLKAGMIFGVGTQHEGICFPGEQEKFTQEIVLQ